MLLAHVTGLPHHPEEYRGLATLLCFAPVVARLLIHKLKNRKSKTMPCDTIQTTRVDLGNVDPGLISAAIKALGLSSNVSYVQDRLVIRGLPEAETTAQVKQAYGAEVVKSQAAKFGWQLKQTAPFKYEVVKR